jgi:serine/alanine adding enzyme
MKVLLNDQIPLTLWNLLVNTSHFATPFQTNEFFKLINSIPDFSATAVAIEDSGLLLALAVITMQKEQGIKGYFSRRGIIYGGPLFDFQNKDASDFLLKILSSSIGDNLIYIETRNLSDYGNYKEIFKNHGWVYIPYLNFNLNTRDKGSMTHAISISRLRQIKKTLKSGTFWKEAVTVEEVRAFYKILLSLYQKKIKKPLFPWEFFRQCFEQKFGKYLLVYFNEKIIGGIMCPIIRNKAIYEFYVCGLDEDYKEQYPSVMATWAAMEYANQNNIPVFNFMGAGKPNERYGVREFKARFGGEVVEYGRFLKINNHFMYNLGKFGLKLSKGFTK